MDTKSLVTKQTKEELNFLSDIMPVELAWVRAHKGILGIEIADRAAKIGSKTRMTDDEVLRTKTAVKEVVNKQVYETWNRRWTNQSLCRQTKLFFPTIERGKSKDIMKLSKANLGVLVRNTTGHRIRNLCYHCLFCVIHFRAHFRAQSHCLGCTVFL